MTKIYITGDSHTVALKHGNERLDEAKSRNADLKILVDYIDSGLTLKKQFFECIDGQILVHSTKRSEPIRFSKESLADQWVGVCIPYNSMRFSTDPSWAKFSAFGESQDLAPVSKSLFDSMVRSDQSHVLSFIDALLAITPKVFVIESPLVFKHHRYVDLIGAEKILKIDVAYRKIIDAEMSKRDLKVIRVPSKCKTGQGFMEPKYHVGNPNDQAHCNADYGLLMLKEIEKQVKKWANSER